MKQILIDGLERNTRRRCLEILILPTVVCLALCSGCGEGVPVAQSDSKNEVAESIEAASERVRQFNGELGRLTSEAHALEQEFKFDEAVVVWKRLATIIVGHYGTESWQAKNAQIAMAAALQKSAFGNEQKQQLGKLASLKKQIRQAVAENEFDRALELNLNLQAMHQELFGTDSIESGQSLIQTGLMESRLGMGDRAIQRVHAGVKILSNNDFGDHPELELAHATLAELYAGQEKFGPAVANQKQATRISGSIWGRQSLEFATQANQLGVIFHRAGNLDVAFEILAQARKIRQQLLGADDAAFAHSCLNLGIVQLDRKQFDDADDLLKTALSVFEKQSGPDDSMTLRCKTQIANIYMLRQEPGKAEPLLTDIVNSMSRSNDQDAAQLLSCQYRLAIALARQGKYDRAQPLIQSVIERQQNLYGLSDRRTIDSLQAYALMLESTHQQETATQIRQQINRVARNTGDNDFQPRY